jgi:hypothetical protein
MAQTLYEYYKSKGQALPGIKERAKTYEDLGLGSATNYQGTYNQNVSLLNRLQSMPINPTPASKPQVAQNLPVSAPVQPDSTNSTPSANSTSFADRYQQMLEEAFKTPLPSKADLYQQELTSRNIEPQRQSLQSLDSRLVAMKANIDASEQDIRNRIIQSGGTVTESQTQRLVAAEKEPLLREYNRLIDERNAASQQLSSAEQLAEQTAGLKYESAAQPLATLKERLGMAKDVLGLQQTAAGAKTVTTLMTQYPDAGILASDTPEIASLKAAQSGSFKSKNTAIRGIVDPVYGGISYYDSKGGFVGNTNHGYVPPAGATVSETPSTTSVASGTPSPSVSIPTIIKPAIQNIEGVPFIDMGKLNTGQVPLAQKIAATTGMPLLAKDDVNEVQKGYATYLSERNIMNTILTTARKLITATNPAEALWQYAKIEAGALTRTNTDAKVFLDTTKAFSSLLTRAAGEKGVLTNMDVQRIINGLPNSGDTKSIMEEKATKFDALFKSQFQSAMQAYVGQTSGQSSGSGQTGGQADINSLRSKYGY